MRRLGEPGRDPGIAQPDCRPRDAAGHPPPLSASRLRHTDSPPPPRRRRRRIPQLEEVGVFLRDRAEGRGEQRGQEERKDGEDGMVGEGWDGWFEQEHMTRGPDTPLRANRITPLSAIADPSCVGNDGLHVAPSHVLEAN